MATLRNLGTLRLHNLSTLRRRNLGTLRRNLRKLCRKLCAAMTPSQARPLEVLLLEQRRERIWWRASHQLTRSLFLWTRVTDC